MREEQPLTPPCSCSAPSHLGAPPPSWAGLVLAILPTLPSAHDQACPSLNTPELTLAITPVALRLGQQGCLGHLSPLLGETLVVFSGRGWGPGEGELNEGGGLPALRPRATMPAGAPHVLLLCSSVTQQNSCLVGEVVRGIDDLDTVKRLQAGHGEWTDDMAPVSPPPLPPCPSY